MLGIKLRSFQRWNHRINSFMFKSALFALSLFLITSSLNAQVIIDGLGFEPGSPAYNLGNLEGQAATLPNDPPFPGFQSWLASMGTTSTAVVQSTVVNSGSQAVQLTRAANEAPGGGRFGVPVVGWPDNARHVCIEWNMLVEDAMGPAGSFGPFFGVESFDDAGVGSTKGRLGTLGVDATTGDVLYLEAGGGFAETTATVNFGVWNNFRIDLDFQLHEYTTFLNGVPLQMGAPGDFSEPFDEGSFLNDFSDAPLSALAAGGDSVSQGLTGVAYFDDYIVYQVDVKIPEPGTLMLVVASLAALPWTSRRSSR